MGVTEESVRRLRRHYPGIVVVARSNTPVSPARTALIDLLADRPGLTGTLINPLSGPILAVRVSVQGIVGGHSRVRCSYALIVDTSDLQRAIPPVWVASPQDSDIKHVNIWPENKSFCRFVGKNLPSFCWNTFANGWSRAPRPSRTLGNALEFAKQLLNTENYDSPAR
jgi:hypothetical protein